MLILSKRLGSVAGLAVLAGALGGCVTGSQVSYSAYQYSPYGSPARTYERNVYSDSAHGLEAERCRTVIKRRINPYGEEVVRRDRICGPTGDVSAAKPWSRRSVRRNSYTPY